MTIDDIMVSIAIATLTFFTSPQVKWDNRDLVIAFGKFKQKCKLTLTLPTVFLKMLITNCPQVGTLHASEGFLINI